MENNNVQDKWLIVYQGPLVNYKNDALKDNYQNKLVLVTGVKDSSNIDLVKSYLCVSDGTNNVEIPIPSLYFETIKIDGSKYGVKNNILEFAEANGIDISFDMRTGAVNIGIDEATLTKINSAIQEIESADGDYITISTKDDTTVPTKVIKAETALINGSGNGLATAEDVRASIPETLPNPNALEISLNGLPVKTYDGSSTYRLSFYAPTKVGSKGQVFKSMDGITVDWGNVDWSEIKNKPDVINFAKDLTGVLVPSSEEFTYRSSARDTSIRDGGAIIRRIKGNTTVWNQHIPSGSNPGAIPGDSNYLTVSIENSEWIGTVKNVDSGCNNPWKVGIRVSTSKPIVNHKYLICMNIYTSKAPKNSTDYFALEYGGSVFSVYPSSEQTEKWFSASRIFTQASDNSRTYAIIRPYWSYLYDYGIQNGDYYKVKDVMLFDLTLLFGAGNEPQTYDEFKEIYPDIYPYCEPKIRTMRTTAIETIGFNQWDEQWEVGRFDTVTGENRESNNIRCKNLIKVLPNTVYSLSVGDSMSGIWAMFYDNNENILTPIIYSDDSWISGNSLRISPNIRDNAFITPEGTSWMKFYLETYYGSTYTNDVCISLFHTGIRRGEYEPYKKNTLLLPEITEYFHDGMNGIGDVYDEINSENAIQRCAKRDYVEGDESNANVVTDGKTTIYKLDVPSIAPISEPLQLAYEVEDFGTERAIAPEDSAPFRADIVYQFNAEGRIRDNGRNIERLEKNLNGRFDNNFVIANGVVDDDDHYYHLPSKRGDTPQYNLATEQYVEDRISTIELSGDALLPTEIDTTTNGNQSYIIRANRVYIFLNPINNCNFRLNVDNTISGKDNKWCFRFQAGQGPYNIDTPLSSTYKIIWKDYTPPTFEKNSWYEISFTISGPIFLGEYKRYYALQPSLDK